jgi:hypothetical protein
MDVTMRVAATGRRVRVLLHHAAARRAETEQWSAAMDRRDLMIIDDAVAEPWRVVGGIDAALLAGGELNTIDLSGAGSPFAMLTFLYPIRALQEFVPIYCLTINYFLEYLLEGHFLLRFTE